MAGMTGIQRGVSVPAALLLALGAVSACSGDTSGPETGASVEDISGVAEDDAIGLDEGDIAEFQEYLGDTVTVSADVNQILAQRAFTIGGPNTDAQPLLVISPTDRELPPGTPVRVTGVVRTFVFDELSRQDAQMLLQAGQAQWLAFDGEPYVAATELEILP